MLCILIILYICTYGISAHRPLPHVHFYCYLPIKIIIYILIRNAVPPTTSSGRVHCACFAFQSVCVLQLSTQCPKIDVVSLSIEPVNYCQQLNAKLAGQLFFCSNNDLSMQEMQLFSII